MHKYEIITYWSEEDGSFIAEVPELAGCMADGASHEEAVRNAQEALMGKAFPKSLASLCRDLGVETIAEMVDDEKRLKFIRECGVQYVQGYLFGKPNRDIKTFEKLRRPALFPQWRV